MKKITKRIRQERREEANERNVAYAALSFDDKLAKAGKRQRERLLKLTPKPIA